MIILDDVTREIIKKHNPIWPQIPDHLYWILLIGGCGSGETNTCLNLIDYQLDIDKIFYPLKISIKQNVNC